MGGGVQKSIPFAARYSSGTFNQSQQILVGANGVVSGGGVTTSGNIATINPLTFVQNGLFVTPPGPLSATIPTGLTAPYFIVVTTSTNMINPTEVITPTFAKRPEDVSPNSVIVAEWDGQEWRNLPYLQLNEIIVGAQMAAVAGESVGVASGFGVSVSSGTITVEPGALIDAQGALTVKKQAAAFPVLASDADGLERIDQILFRRPDDSFARCGVVDYVVGEVVDPDNGVSFYHLTQIGTSSIQNSASKIVNIPGSNLTLFFYLQDTGSRSTLILVSSPDALTTISSKITIATNVADFSAVYNPDGSVDIVYTRGNTLYYQRVSTSGSSIYAEKAIAVDTVTLLNPRVVTILNGPTYFLHVVYERAQSNSVHQLYYVRLSSANTVETSAVLLVDLSSVVTQPSIDKDDDDSLLILAYANSTTGRCYLQTYDASTSTGSSGPTQLGSTLELEDDTYILSAMTTAPTGGSSHPRVHRAANKDTLVFFLQSKDGTNNGVAVYSPRFLRLYGHKAVIQDLTEVGENIAGFDVALDGMSTAHFILSVGVYLTKASLQVDIMSVLGTPGSVVTPIMPSGYHIAFTSRGALIHTYAPATSGYQTNGSTLTIQYFGSGNFMGTVPIAANEFVMLQSDYNSLPSVPTTGDEVTITNATANNGSYAWTGVRSFVHSSINYVAVATNVSAFSNSVASGTAQFQTQAGTGTYFVKSTAGITNNLRSVYLTPTDVSLSQYRTSDGVLAVAGTALEENITISRLYEFFNAFAGASGQISWSVSAANELVFMSTVVFNFFNRVSQYTIPAGSITIDANQVAYVTIPDEDTASNLSLEVVNFGAGILDRYGKNSFPLFWNIGGVLYMKFAPYRLESSGQTVSLGSQFSTQFMSWLGISSPAPDPTNHGYTSLNFITQADTPPAAISSLDAAVEYIINNKAIEEQIDISTPTSTINAMILNWDPSNSNPDIVVTVNGRKQRLDLTGAGIQDFIKTSSTSLEFSYVIPDNASVIIREERTGGTIGNVGSGLPQEDIQLVTSPSGITTYTSSDIIWNPLSSVPDISIFVNGRRLQLDPAGSTGYDYYKTSNNTVVFTFTLPQNALLTLRKEPSGVGGGGGGSVDLTNITVNPQPDTNGDHSLGTSAKAWSFLVLQDQSTSQNYQISMNSGVLTLTPV